MATTTVTNTNNLSIGLTNSQNKLEYLKIPNPRSNLSEEDIRTAAEKFVSPGILIDNYDEVISDTSAITTAFTTKTTVTTYEF